jgi:DeoR/GlpR family transcriptional regulator of sugar metabolism
VNSFERKKHILDKLRGDGTVSINSLADALGVTRVTIRTDLDTLEQRGLLLRTHGGAVVPEHYHLARHIDSTLQERRQEKEAIAKLAAAQVEDGSTLILDAGSTTAIAARFLVDRRITVVTNSLLVLQELSASETVELLVAGGALRKPDLALIGSLSQHVFERLHPDLVFLGANGFCVERGVTCANLIEAETKRFMIKSANRVLLLADSSKSGRTALAHVCDWDEIDVLVTDRLSGEDREALSGLGVEVMTP